MRTLSKNKLGRYVDGFQPLSENYTAVTLPVTSGVAISKGDIITFASGFMSLATTLAGGADGKSMMYVALSENTAAEASSDGAIDVTCIPITDTNVRYMVPVTTDAVLAQATHVGNVYDLDGSEDGLSVAAALSADFGFFIEEIDISAEALAVETDGYAIGRFMAFAETT